MGNIFYWLHRNAPPPEGGEEPSAPGNIFQWIRWVAGAIDFPVDWCTVTATISDWTIASSTVTDWTLINAAVADWTMTNSVVADWALTNATITDWTVASEVIDCG